ncbi:hypothetical protein NKJ40_29585 [Mesorhizobium sp. M0119]|uniref:hypothetical protein n=1 Tax=unclassified Mesorhizobium TaxID=325217 RepID=UPI003335E04E
MGVEGLSISHAINRLGTFHDDLDVELLCDADEAAAWFLGAIVRRESRIFVAFNRATLAGAS